MERRLPLVNIRNVGKRYGQGPWVLDNLSCEIHEGEFVSLIGPSGCGKSTLLKLIASLSPVSKGEIQVEGNSSEIAREQMSFIFQEATLLPWLNVWRNIEVPLRLKGLSREDRDRMSEKLLKLVRLEHVQGYYPRQLSGGMKMRVSLARALASSPKILLMDEPFGALDEMTRNHLNEELLALREVEGWTALFVTHSVAEAVFLSSRVLILGVDVAGIREDVAINLPYPRSAETRESSEYQGLVGEISRKLRAVESSS
jgi:NitT/TauT family transport system ATP-binding protein